MRSAIPKDVKMSLKVMVNKEKTKVLFAEADSKSVEVILSFLMLPLGEIVRVFEEHYLDKKPVVGSLTTLYRSLTTLHSNCFWTDGGKKMLLNPSSSFMGGPVKHFRCGDINCKNKGFLYVSIYYDSGTCDCGKPLNRAMGEIEPKPQAGGDGILVEGLHFLVTDDLQVAPYEPGSMIQTLVNLGIVVTEGAEQLNVTLGYNEIVDLLNGLLLSKTPLTDVVLRVSNKNTGYVLENLLLDNLEPESTSSKRMTVTAIMQKSTNKYLFLRAKEDFVDFVLSFLTIPLGGVESLLRGKTCFKGIDNLYNSTANLIKDGHFITKDAKRRLQEPELPPYYVSKNQIFSLSEQIVPSIYYYESVTDSSNRTVEKGFWIGKTTLARHIFEHALVKHHFDFCAWTTISQIYNVRETLSQVLQQVRENLGSDLSEEDLGVKLRKYLLCRRYLIILDDMSSVEVWEEMMDFFPDNNNDGSRIIVTTRLSNLATELTNSNIMGMKVLDDVRSWSLFSKTVFGDEVFPLHLKKIGKKIVGKCKGLPLPIAVIGGLLAIIYLSVLL